MARPPLEPGITPVRSRTSETSDYVLLSHERSPLLRSSTSSPHPLTTTTPLPRPRFVWVLQLACLVDLFAILLAGTQVPALPKSAVVLSVARPVFVAAVVSSKKVRSMGPLLLAQIMISFLVLLYRVNELVQTSSSLSLSLISTSAPSFTSLLPALHIPHLSRLLNPTSRWYLLSFSFSLIHYALFAIFVGVRRRRNPFVGGAGRGMRRSSTWAEQEWAGREEVVGVPAVGRSRMETFSRTSRMHDPELDAGIAQREGGATGGEVEEGREDEVDDDERIDLDDTEASSSEDEDDIIDIPRTGGTGGGGTLRNRASRASLLSVRAGGGAAEGATSPPLTQPESERPPGLRASRGFGSMRSLAGI
ncbi:hypothetical protein JCM11251_004989 [Rhodosporidiobolus azoricus]